MENEVQDPGALARALRWGKNQFSLDPQPDQDLLSAETAGDTALGFVPGATIPMAARDFERARREDDKLGMGLAAVSALPLGNLVKGLRDPVRKIIAGSAAKEAPFEAMLDARNALKKGIDPEEVWQKHGVFKGYDKGTESGGKLKWEIPDTNAKFKKGLDIRNYFGDDVERKFEGKLGDMLDHPELFKNYPHLKDYDVSARHTGHEASGRILGNKIEAYGEDPDALMKILLHEVQHGVQKYEKFARGGSPEQFASKLTREAVEANPEKAAEIFDVKGPLWKKIADKARSMYDRLPGEVEARTVERRRDMMPETLRKFSPLKTAAQYEYTPDKLHVPKELFGPVFGPYP